MSQPAACRALPGKGQAWRRSEKYEGFSWHSCRRQTILEAGALLDKARSAKGKAHPRAIDWRRLQQLPDGYYLQWKKPVSFVAGYKLFIRLLGQLAHERGQTLRVASGGPPARFGAAACHACSGSRHPPPLAREAPEARLGPRPA